MIIFRLSEYSYTMSTLAPLQSTKKNTLLSTCIFKLSYRGISIKQ